MIEREANLQGITFEPIGIVHTNASDDEIRSRKSGIESTVEIYSKYEDALDGLEGLSHIFVVGYFHRLRSEQIGPLKVKPKGLLKRGLKIEELPLIGVLALDSPTRPNPIGLSLVRLKKIENKRNLVVSDLDYFDGTPVLDVKPYQRSYIAEQYTLPDWHVKLMQKAEQKVLSP